jgi:hypothetical protein
MDIIGDSTLITLQTPHAVTADGSTGGVDCRSLRGQGAAILTVIPTAGTDPTLAIKLQHAQDGDIVTSVTPGGGNTGNGTCTQVYGGPDAVAENITLTFADATSGTVVGSVTGPLADFVVGTLYQSANVEFMLTAGSTAFVGTDAFVIVTAARTYADVGGGAFTALTDARAVEKINLDYDKLGRWLRVNYDIGGTDNPSYTVTVIAQAMDH